MKTKRTLLVAAVAVIVVLSAALPTAIGLQRAVVTNVDGTLRFVQNVPCNQVLSFEMPVRGGRMEMMPPRGIEVERGEKIFNLTGLTVSFRHFNVHGDCRRIRDSHKVTELGVRLASSVSFRGTPVGDDRYRVRIPRNQFLLAEAFVDNDVSKNIYMKPAEDVTGVIDLGRRIVRLHIVVAWQLLFRAGCADFSNGGCIINEIDNGTQTADVSGRIVFPPGSEAR